MADKVTLATLKASNPDVYAEAVAEGIESERKRVKAHLRIGESAGALETAIKAVRDGTAWDDAEIQAEYMSAGVKKAAQDARAADDTPTGEAADAAGTGEQDAIEGSEQVVAAIEAEFGKPSESE